MKPLHLPVDPSNQREFNRRVAQTVNQIIEKYEVREWPTSGTTANRPSGVPTGWFYFDTTLNRPIWFGNSGWIKADGTAA